MTKIKASNKMLLQLDLIDIYFEPALIIIGYEKTLTNRAWVLYYKRYISDKRYKRYRITNLRKSNI